jgi:hydroxymethylpyrimidine/phosphomethylpyrimidine kinase
MIRQDNNIVLTITGSDSTGESGAQADLRTIEALGGRPVSAITSVTVQNTVGIQQFYDLPSAVVMGQVEAIMNDVEPSVIKVGMVRRAELVDLLCADIVRYQPRHVVFHPVIRSARGERLMDPDLALKFRNQLMPLCSLTIVRRDDARWLLPAPDPARVLLLSDEPSLHGRDNALSSAIATLLSQGLSQDQAIEQAQAYVQNMVLKTDKLKGRGEQLYNDFLDQVDLHLRERSDVQYYADLLNVSSRYLGQVTRRVAGRSPKAIIDGKLSALIRQMLEGTQLTVQEIANSVGFSSQAHLSRFFRKFTGTTPSQYRVGKKS